MRTQLHIKNRPKLKGNTMSNPSVVPTPNHRDKERALRGALARMRGDNDVLPLLARECVTPTDVDMCIVAAFDALVKLLTLKTSDPVTYLTQWIALERQLAITEDDARDSDTNRDSDDDGDGDGDDNDAPEIVE